MRGPARCVRISLQPCRCHSIMYSHVFNQCTRVPQHNNSQQLFFQTCQALPSVFWIEHRSCHTNMAVCAEVELHSVRSRQEKKKRKVYAARRYNVHDNVLSETRYKMHHFIMAFANTVSILSGSLPCERPNGWKFHSMRNMQSTVRTIP